MTLTGAVPGLAVPGLAVPGLAAAAGNTPPAPLPALGYATAPPTALTADAGTATAGTWP